MTDKKQDFSCEDCENSYYDGERDEIFCNVDLRCDNGNLFKKKATL